MVRKLIKKTLISTSIAIKKENPGNFPHYCYVAKFLVKKKFLLQHYSYFYATVAGSCENNESWDKISLN